MPETSERNRNETETEIRAVMQVSSGACCQQRQGEGERRHGLLTNLHVKEHEEKKTHHHGSCGSSFVLWRASRSICPQQQRPSLSAPGLRKRLTTTRDGHGCQNRGWVVEHLVFLSNMEKRTTMFPSATLSHPISPWIRNTTMNCTTRLDLTCRSKIEM